MRRGLLTRCAADPVLVCCVRSVCSARCDDTGAVSAKSSSDGTGCSSTQSGTYR